MYRILYDTKNYVPILYALFTLNILHIEPQRLKRGGGGGGE